MGRLFSNGMRLFFLISLALIMLVVSFPGTARAEFLTEEDRARLQTQLDSIQAEIAEWQAVINDTRAKKATLQGDVTSLDALIKKATAEIKSRNISIKSITDEIARKAENITALEAQLERGQNSLARILRIKNQADDQTLPELILSAQDFDSFFGDLDSLAAVQRDLTKFFDEVRTLKERTEGEKAALTDKQNKELDARYQVELTKKQIATNQVEKSKLLKITADSEAAYESVLAARQRQAEQIRNALFPLRDVEGISFGDALNYASAAGKSTGVRAALILAILSQESDLGKNVGSCYVTNITTGDGIGKNSGSAFQKVMKAPRDTVPFKRVTDSLGKIWGATPISCPPGAVYTSSRGFGGAMGPSQFIPSTWELYVNRLRTVLGLGSATPNPWDAGHAIMATALYLQDLGAAGNSYTAERNASCRYYSGRSCDTKTPTNYKYGDSVIAKTEGFQTNIDFLKGI